MNPKSLFKKRFSVLKNEKTNTLKYLNYISNFIFFTGIYSSILIKFDLFFFDLCHSSKSTKDSISQSKTKAKNLGSLFYKSIHYIHSKSIICDFI